MTTKISLFLMTEKGFEVIKNLVAFAGNSNIECVVSARDKNVQNDFFDEIEKFCTESGINFYLKDNFQIKESKYCIAIGWRWLINLEEGRKLIVLHDALLPKYRGFAPVVSALINGDKEIGCSAIFASEEYDTGDILVQKSFSVNYPIKINDAIKIMGISYSEIVNELYIKISSGQKLISIAQNNELASYSLWRDNTDYTIDWNLNADSIKRFIDAVGYPYAGALAYVGNEQIRIIEAEIQQDVQIAIRDAGKVIFIKNDMPVIVCGQGLLKIVEMTTADGQPYKLKNFRSRFLKTPT